ncbi:MAG: hypothetical protein FJ041_01100 [Candidatus Cloacimonetes bacterium]|nr:hypothetical protein [Candidatus Cloacimonadota bacterium]
MKYILLLTLAAIVLMACVSNYYDRFGGFPVASQELHIKYDNTDILLKITFRLPYKADVPDTTIMNVSVSIVLAEKVRKSVFVERLVLKAQDNSYLNTISYPAVYDTYGRYPVSQRWTNPATGRTYQSSDQPNVFTVSRATKDFNIVLGLQTLNPAGVYDYIEKELLLSLPEIEIKSPAPIRF